MPVCKGDVETLKDKCTISAYIVGRGEDCGPTATAEGSARLVIESGEGISLSHAVLRGVRDNGLYCDVCLRDTCFPRSTAPGDYPSSTKLGAEETQSRSAIGAAHGDYRSSLASTNYDTNVR